jgi:hypothetical protein
VQHCALDVQAEPGGKQVAACAGVGATIEVTKGTATIAASPKVLTICRLDIPLIMAGSVTRSSNNWSLDSWSSANHTIFSSMGAFNSKDTESVICETEA